MKVNLMLNIKEREREKNQKCWIISKGFNFPVKWAFSLYRNYPLINVFWFVFIREFLLAQINFLRNLFIIILILNKQTHQGIYFLNTMWLLLL